MSDVVIKVEGLSKQYRYGQSGFSRASLREALTEGARSLGHGARSLVTAPFRRFSNQPSALSDQPSALSDQPSANPQSDSSSLRPSVSAPSRSALPNLQSEISNLQSEDGSFWALRDVTFEVNRGEVLRNAQRSTSSAATAPAREICNRKSEIPNGRSSPASPPLLAVLCLFAAEPPPSSKSAPASTPSSPAAQSAICNLQSQIQWAPSSA
jgi:hypothetical protein